jgi:mannose-1-phosphate guanylyltransferase
VLTTHITFSHSSISFGFHYFLYKIRNEWRDAKMKALLLAGGLGTRLRPLTENLPKPMAPIANRPWLEHLITHLRDQGIDQFVMAARHCSDVIRRYFGDGRRWGVKIEYAVEPFPMGTAGAIKNAERLLNERFLVVNADIVHLPELIPILEFHKQHGGIATIVLTEVEDPSPYGVVEQDAAGRILRFVEKPRPEEAPSNRINAGLYILEPEVMDYIPAQREVSIERETFPRLIRENAGVYGIVSNGYWRDMGTPARYRQVHWDVLDRRFPLSLQGQLVHAGVWTGEKVEFGSGALLLPPVLIGNNVKIGDQTVIGPYAVIGDNCQIGSRVHCSHSILWDQSVVRDGSRLNNSIFGYRTVTPAGEEFKNSIINQSVEVMQA